MYSSPFSAITITPPQILLLLSLLPSSLAHKLLLLFFFLLSRSYFWKHRVMINPAPSYSSFPLHSLHSYYFSSSPICHIILLQMTSTRVLCSLLGDPPVGRAKYLHCWTSIQEVRRDYCVDLICSSVWLSWLLLMSFLFIVIADLSLHSIIPFPYYLHHTTIVYSTLLMLLTTTTTALNLKSQQIQSAKEGKKIPEKRESGEPYFNALLIY